MSRISKDPAVRRQELVLAACELIKEKGYEQVSVSDIVKKVGVAQGTFYYYFDTKYDMLDAVMEYYVQKSMDLMKKVSDDKTLDPMEKLQTIVSYTLKQDMCEKNFIEYLHSGDNQIAHDTFMRKTFETTIPIITAIVEEGVALGMFKVRHPWETVELMVYMYGLLHDSLALTTDRDLYYRKIGAAEDIFARVLGIKDESIRIVS